MMKNFYVLKRFNNSDKYALAVGHLADQIGGAGEFIKEVPRPYPKLPLAERKELQRKLAKMGLYKKDIDGNIGSGTRAAIKRAQIKMGLNPTGFETPEFCDTVAQSDISPVKFRQRIGVEFVVSRSPLRNCHAGPGVCDRGDPGILICAVTVS